MAKRGFATITQMRSGRWQVRYTAPSGQRLTAGKTFDAKIDAEAWVTDKRREIDRGVWRDPQDMPERVAFGVYAARWLEGRHVAGRPIKERTRTHYQAILDDHLLDSFGGRLVSAIRPNDVRDWYAQTLTDKPTMRAHAYSLLRTILASAVNDEVIDANPARIVGAGRAKRVKKIRPANIEELATLTAEMPERLQLMVALASWCALRFGETIELRRGDIDLFAEVIRIRRAATRVGGSHVVTSPKSDAGVRDVDIPPHLVPVIEAHLSKFVDRGRDALLFPADHGGHLQPSTVYRWWYKARAKANREDLRWHDLRHSGAVLTAATGASIAELMERLGHSSPSAAMRYQHAVKGRGREIAALLSKLAQDAS